MILQFNWDRLDVMAAEAIRALVNAKLEEELRRRAALSGGVDAPAVGGSTRAESLCVTGIEWGIAPPFIEILELDDAQDLSRANFTPHDTIHSRQEAASHCNLFRLSSPVSSQYGGEHGSEVDSLPGGCPSASVTKRMPGAWMGSSVPRSGSPVVPSKDTLAPFVGLGGLYILLHVTYGGQMRLSVSCVLRHDIPLGSISLPVRMPLTLLVSKMDMDFYLSINLHQNKCRVWMEPGKLSTSPITRMNIKAVFGERRTYSSQLLDNWTGIPPVCEDADTSDAWTHVTSSHLGSEEEDDAVFTEENVISRFVLSEIRAILQEKIIYPHFVEVPLFL
ncbi:hypothetical protein TcG_04768 [Trypanosoma cruzi]|uniref:SMP-LTD domain-containing protein n=2 Tax=Trypanosoma cruzi TaxID=5693 RepID=V5DBB8_TRYCR|nr:hypothetical protein TCDM_07101 [Trypanosoma cruzi Dm28c]KAF8283096.1 hypothetical protein TcBrA4_0078450 [Trypanosoma cruzi]PBJ72241.1 hypothetical protein BCY84_15824 [Trypanosoma cruzi cruzi]RNF18656.1 hypothetical protein TcG_04768 [Trypanosoma cruzi]